MLDPAAAVVRGAVLRMARDATRRSVRHRRRVRGCASFGARYLPDLHRDRTTWAVCRSRLAVAVPVAPDAGTRGVVARRASSPARGLQDERCGCVARHAAGLWVLTEWSARLAVHGLRLARPRVQRDRRWLMAYAPLLGLDGMSRAVLRPRARPRRPVADRTDARRGRRPARAGAIGARCGAAVWARRTGRTCGRSRKTRSASR